MTIKDIELNNLKSPTEKASLGPGRFSRGFYRTFNEKSTPQLRILFLKIIEEKILFDSFYEASITLLSKPDKDSRWKRKPQISISHEFGYVLTKC